MSRVGRIARNASYLLIAQVVLNVITVLLSIAIARSLGPTGYGNYSFATAFTALFVIFADLGYETILTREVSKDNSKASLYLRKVSGFRFPFALILFFSIVLTINLMGYPSDVKTIVYIFGAYSLTTSLSVMYRDVFRAFEQMKYEMLIIISGSMIRATFGLLALFLGYGLLALGIVFLLSGIFEFVLNVLICNWKAVRPRVGFDLNFMKETIWMALPLSLFSALTLIFVRADTVLLSVMKGQEVVGWYNAAYNLIVALKIIPAMFLNALFPAALKASRESKDLYCLYYNKAVKYLIALAIPIAIGITLLSGQIITLLYGSKFANSIDALSILAWDCALFFVYYALSSSLIGLGNERFVALSALVCVLVNIAFNILLIPAYGLIASSVVTVGSEGVLLVLYLYFFRRSVGHIPIHTYLVKPLIASVPMVLLILLVNANLLMVVPLSAAAYVATFIIIGGLDLQEAEMIRTYLRSLKGRIMGS